LSWRLGIRETKQAIPGVGLADTYQKNFETEVSIGGPTCVYNGITVPCFVCCTPNASITSELWAQMLKHIDDTGIFPRSEEEGCPFLLIDGHQS
jgi:hypothetical protein